MTTIKRVVRTETIEQNGVLISYSKEAKLEIEIPRSLTDPEVEIYIVELKNNYLTINKIIFEIGLKEKHFSIDLTGKIISSDNEIDPHFYLVRPYVIEFLMK